MDFYSRKWIKPEDLNPNGSLFGGRLLSWIDEESVIYAMTRLGNNKHLVTKVMSEVNFISSARLGDVIEMGVGVIGVGKTSITLCAEIRNKVTKATIVSIDRIVFVNMGDDARPAEHGFSKDTLPQAP
ncbi:MAG: acyl-CoA thioesterase [Porticoccaceae bacterium]|nr:acyl-CoA thioesterase [Porticoccaceae bacterium]